MPKTSIKTKDKWVPTVCSSCYGGCSIAHVVDDVVVKVEGNPNSPIGNGKCCPKGVAGVMMLYDPNRVNKPLMRTNPEKGIGIDPKWKEISWDEALDIITEKMKKVYQEDGRKLFYQGTTTCPSVMKTMPFAILNAFGSKNLYVGGGGLHCGNNAHTLSGLYHSSWSVVPDYQYCNYAIYFGASKGHAAGHVANPNAQQAADARGRGMKLVVVDPMHNFASGKATEWVAIIPGTDSALVLAMINVLINDLKIYDQEFLVHKTNAPYLVKPDGFLLRDEQTGKPMVWDLIDGKAKPFDAEIGSFALEGEYQVEGEKYPTSFEILKNHVKQYTPEFAEKITSIPAAKIRELATDFGREAKVGSTITIDGKVLPYRPVSAVFFRGAQGHKNGFHNAFAISLLNLIVGCSDNVGGTLGFNPTCYGHPETGKPHYVPYADEDGMMITGTWVMPHKVYPPEKPTSKPEKMGLNDIFTANLNSPVYASSDQEELWNKVNLPYRPEIVMNFGCNSVMSVGSPETVAETLKRIPFMFSFDLFLNETTDFADIVLPDTSYFERYDAVPNEPFIFNHTAGLGTWGWPIRQPVIPNQGERRDMAEVLLELADRIGIRSKINQHFNEYFELSEPYQLKGDKKYSWEEICDRRLKEVFGEKRGLNWFKENGVITWPKKVEEVYWRSHLNVRVPIYMEFIKKLHDRTKELCETKYGIDMDWEYYQPIPHWFPCKSMEEKDSEYDTWGFYYRHILHCNSFTMENPWLDEQSAKFPGTYDISINMHTAKKKGIKDGDMIWMETPTGRKIKGRARLMEGIHPNCAGVSSLAGHWSKDQPIALGKGVFFNDLLEVDLKHSDPVTLNLDVCVKLKIYKA